MSVRGIIKEPVTIELLAGQWKITVNSTANVQYYYLLELRGSVYTASDGVEYVELRTRYGDVCLLLVDFTEITQVGFTAATPELLITELITQA
jgi:hypothetical protein